MEKCRLLLWSLIWRSGVVNFLSDLYFSKLVYWCYTGKRLDLKHPTDFNAKIQWLKLYYHNPAIPICADKYAVRSFVADRIGKKYLTECVGVFKDVNEIDFSKLPDRFVLKATHGSGWNIICQDKKFLDWKVACKKMTKWLSDDFSKVGREWQYSKIQPRIICEKYIEGVECAGLQDYRLFTFNGETKYILVEFYKSIADHTVQKIGVSKPSKMGGVRHYTNFYTPDWRIVDGVCIKPGTSDGDLLSRPIVLEEMICLAKKLSSDFPFCRVDFYVIGGKQVVFSELTFTPGKGCYRFNSVPFSEEMGSCIKLPERNA